MHAKKSNGIGAVRRRPMVLFDGGCPLCRREIRHYQRRPGALGIDWVDLSQQPRDAEIDGVAWQQAMSRFHVRDLDGNWQHGAAGFVYLWSQLKPYWVLAKLVKTLRLTPILERAYQIFAERRSRSHCNDQHCNIAWSKENVS